MMVFLISHNIYIFKWICFLDKIFSKKKYLIFFFKSSTAMFGFGKFKGKCKRKKNKEKKKKNK